MEFESLVSILPAGILEFVSLIGMPFAAVSNFVWKNMICGRCTPDIGASPKRKRSMRSVANIVFSQFLPLNVDFAFPWHVF